MLKEAPETSKQLDFFLSEKDVQKSPFSNNILTWYTNHLYQKLPSKQVAERNY